MGTVHPFRRTQQGPRKVTVGVLEAGADEPFGSGDEADDGSGWVAAAAVVVAVVVSVSVVAAVAFGCCCCCCLDEASCGFGN